jgi:uncharacterized protein
MKLISALAGVLVAATVWAAEPAPLNFTAVLTVGKDQRFGVSTPDGTRSGWLEIGGQFEGYTLKEFEAANQTLVLERDGQTFRVPIATASIQTLKSTATLADASEVLVKMKFEQMLGKLLDQQKSTLVNASKQMMGSLAAQVSQEDFAAYQSRLLDTIWAEMRPEEMKSEMARIYAEIFSKEELRAMSEFYSTPAGQALIDRQPEMQQKMMDLMMPRMMRAVPRLQQLSQEFAAQQSAKINPPVPPPATK